MCTGIRLLLLICPFISSFFFLSNFQDWNFFVTLFSRTVRPRFKLGTHVDSKQMYHVYRNQAAAAYLSLYFFIFLSLQFSTLNVFVTLFSGTMRPRRLKIGTHVDSGQMYYVYPIPESGCCCLFITLFLHFSFSPVFSIKMFHHSFLRNNEA